MGTVATYMPTNITHIPTNKSYYHIIHAYINRGKTCHPHENKQFHLTTPENFGIEACSAGLALADAAETVTVDSLHATGGKFFEDLGVAGEVAVVD